MDNKPNVFCTHNSNIHMYYIELWKITRTSSKTLNRSIHSEKMKISAVEASSEVDVKVTVQMCGDINLSFDITK